MPVHQLTQAEYQSTFREPMRRLDPDEDFDPVPIGDYISEYMQAHQPSASLESIDIEHVYLSGDKAFSHIVLSYGQSDKRLIIIVNEQAHQIYGHYLLDLAAEYGGNSVAA